MTLKPTPTVNLTALKALICGLSLAGTSALQAQKAVDTSDYKHDEEASSRKESMEDAPQWWKDSMLTLDERMEWWEDARFGLFIHWGPYSVLGGEYQDRAYGGGYAEHIAKFSKIPKADYIRDAAGIFRPEGFDAEEWVKLAKDAGMRYVVITAKHHDGFATYHSKHSDFDFEDTAKWDRDPLMELKEACEKHGLTFGVYYSQAQDWYEEYNVVNIWDFNHPPRSPVTWYKDPKWADHFEKVKSEYVAKKAIPQIEELIEDYGVKVFYFDTPMYFPTDLNLEILKATREAGPDVVVNERIDDVGGWGDYRGGPDTPYYYPVYEERYWEGQQTTTNSWGYNKHDEKNRKTPEFILRMTIDTISKGGNFLMNFSPMGNGTFSAGDMETFKYLAGWAKDHKESIHEVYRNPIAFQNWGFITSRGSTLYLHVHADKWPEDGELILSGLDNDIKKARLMVGNKKLKFKNLGKGLHSISLPDEPSHPLFSGIKIEVDGEPKGDGYRLIDPRTENRLFGYETTYFGGKAEPTGGKKSTALIKGMNPGSSITWKVRVEEAGTYNVQTVYDATNDNGAPSKPYHVTIGDIKLVGDISVEGTGSKEIYEFERAAFRYGEDEYSKFKRKLRVGLKNKPKSIYTEEPFIVEDLGNIELQPGSYDLVVEVPKDYPRGEGTFGFRTVWLNPVK